MEGAEPQDGDAVEERVPGLGHNRQTSTHRLTDAELQAVSGGLNPQPLPPRIAFTALFTNAAVRAFQGAIAWG